MYFCAPMKKNVIYFVSLLAIVLLGSCKSDFERIRASGDPEMIYDKAFELYDKGDYLKAQTLFEQILSVYRGRAKAEQLYFRYAYTHYHLRSYTSAAYYFNSFSTTFVSSPLKVEADFMSAISNYRLSPGYRLDQSNTLVAIEEFQNFINMYPNDPKVEECNNYIDELRKKLETKAFGEGKLYYDLKQYQSAIQSLENLLRDFPESAEAENVRYLILQASYELAENSIYEKKIERYNLVLEKYESFKSKYPNSKKIKEATEIKNSATLKLKELKYV